MNLFDELNKSGLLEYGASFEKALVHEILGLKMPKIGTLEQFQEVQLAELSAIDHVRGILLNMGKYLIGSKSGYRILLPGENQKQAEAYMRQADKKLNRALLLTRNTPKTVVKIESDVDTRIIFKQTRLRHVPVEARA